MYSHVQMYVLQTIAFKQIKKKMHYYYVHVLQLHQTQDKKNTCSRYNVHVLELSFCRHYVIHACVHRTQLFMFILLFKEKNNNICITYMYVENKNIFSIIFIQYSRYTLYIHTCMHV